MATVMPVLRGPVPGLTPTVRRIHSCGSITLGASRFALSTTTV